MLTLRWSATDDDGDPLTFDIYLSRDNPPTEVVAMDASSSSYSVTGLAENTTYFWRVVARDGHGGATSGPIWSFTTGSAPKSGLIAYYPFNGNANDESGNGHDGTVNGATLTSDRFGSSNSAYQFGDGKYIEVPHSSDLNITSSGFTISAWVRFSGTQEDFAGIVAKGPAGGADPGYIFTIRSSIHLGAAIGENGWSDLIGNRSINDNGWHHVVVVQTPSRDTRLYVDGQLDATGRVPSSATISLKNTRPMFIGTERNKSAFLRGAIDEVRLYNYPLSLSEIQALTNQ
jgi:hypothetical protein